MSKAQGEYFIFVDSGLYVSPQWLAIEIGRPKNEHYYDAFGGPIPVIPLFLPLLKAINY